MPVVRCPDCFREINLSQEDLSRIIECSVCEARFGPLAPAPPPPPPPPAPPPPRRTEDDEDKVPHTDPSRPRTRGKRVQPKSMTRFLPIVFGILLGLGASAALIGAIYVLITSQAGQGH